MKSDDFLSQYQIQDFLGEGSYGKVMKVKSKSTGQVYASKIIPLEGLSSKELHRTYEEQRIHSCLRHPNIITVYKSYFEQKQLVIVMEYCEYGDLKYYIRKKVEEEGFFEEPLIINLFIQILFGLEYLHQNKIIHRDIKPSNIFVDSDGRVKLADFGLSKNLSTSLDQTSNVTSMIGTPLYLAPEICINEYPSFKSDIWSVGCVLFQLCSLQPPFQASNILALATMISQKEVSNLHQRYSDEINALIRWMLDKNCKNRPIAQEILKLSFIQKYIVKKQIPSHNPQNMNQMKEQVISFPIFEHSLDLDEESKDEYMEKLVESCKRLLGSDEVFEQMYREIKSFKEQNVIINKKDHEKIGSELVQIYGQQYLDIAKGILELIEFEKSGTN